MAIEVSTESGLCTLRLARPEKQNALTLAMYSALASALRAAEADPAVLSVLITGQPGVFCAGNDLGDFLANPPLGFDAPPYQFMQAVLALSRPLVAAVDGAAVGIGATLLLHCDLVYISDRSRLIYPFVPLGLAPEFGSSLLLPRRLGIQRASRALLLGEPIAAQEAVAMGLASECLAPEAVLPRALEAVARLNAAPANAPIAAKRLMRQREASEIQAAISIEARTFAAQLMNPATQATLRAVLEKRGGRT